MSNPTQPDDEQVAQGATAAVRAAPGGMPTIDEVKLWLGLDADDEIDDALLQTSLDAAISTQGRVCFYPTDIDGNEVVDPDLYEAVLLRTQRYAARRSSPEGVVGISGTTGDFVATRLPATDADIVRLEGPWLLTPVA